MLKSKIKSPKSKLQPQPRPKRRPKSAEPQPRPKRRPKSAESNFKLTDIIPKRRPKSVEPQPRPKLRPKSITKSKEKMFEINHYTVDGERVPYILFKDDKIMSFDDIQDRFDKSKTAPEPIVGMETQKQILKFLQQNNPTKQEFIDFWFTKKASKGGLMNNKRTGHRDMRKGGLFK